MNLSKNIFYDSCKGEFNVELSEDVLIMPKHVTIIAIGIKVEVVLKKKLMVIMVIKVLQLMA